MNTYKNLLRGGIGVAMAIMLPTLIASCSSDESYRGEGEPALAPTVAASVADDDVTMNTALIKVEGIANADSVKYIFLSKSGDTAIDTDGNKTAVEAGVTPTSAEYIRSNGTKLDVAGTAAQQISYAGLAKGSDYTFYIVAFGKRYSFRRATVDLSTLTYNRLGLTAVTEDKVSDTNSKLVFSGSAGTLTIDCYYDSSETFPDGTYKVSAKAAKSGCYALTKNSSFVKVSGEESESLKVKSGTLTVGTDATTGERQFDVTIVAGDNNEYRGTTSAIFGIAPGAE